MQNVSFRCTYETVSEYLYTPRCALGAWDIWLEVICGCNSGYWAVILGPALSHRAHIALPDICSMSGS